MISDITQADRHNSEANLTPNPKNTNPAAQGVHSAGVDINDAPQSPSEASASAKTGRELLRRLSLQDRADLDPRAVHPSLNLSGSIISATFCVPYDVGFAPDL